ncbi:serine protease, partial [Kibdelosporangium aridum]
MSSANARAQKPEWLVRVPGDGGAVAGAGVLIDQYHVVTCAHVVANQFGEPSPTAGTGPAPNDAATVEFPFSGSAAVRRVAQVVEWQPIAEDLSGDAAVLRLAEPVVATAAPLAFPSSVLGHRFSVHGFPSGDSAARYVTGRLGGASGPTGDWLQLDADSGVGWAVERGFSGAPVFDHDVGAVVGIVVMTDAHRSGHMLPMSALRSWWPWLLDRRVEDASWTAHWLPRARGSERQSDTGVWYFTGRDAARQRVCDWLADPTAPALVVTGGPGTGKSALLAHLLVTANPAWADVVPTSGPRPPVGAFDVAIHISGLSGDDVVRQVADAVGLDVATAPELLAAMRQRRQAGQMPVVMVADAVEEAASVAEARQIAVLLRNLAGTGAARVLAGVRTAPSGTKRAEILGAFGSIPRLPLESRAFQRNEDVADYVCLRLTHDDFQSRYRNRPPGELRRISWAIARRARYNFLIAQLTTLWLTQATTPPLNIGEPGWERILPETVGEAMEEYLRHCGADPELVRRILTALAFSRGSGLPFGCSWLTISDALHPAHTHTLADLETVFHSAANYLIERTDDGNEQASYRLYHHALDEHLRDHCTKYTPQPNPHQAIVRALIDALPVREHGRDWATADAYTRTHLAGHAVEAQQLDTVLDDPSFLLYAEPGPLLTALSHARTEEGQLVASTYRLSQHQHRHRHPVDRCRILALDAARLGANELQHRINTAQKHLMAPDQVIWRVRFATGSRLPTAAIATLTGHTNEVNAVAVTELDGR